MIKISVFLEQNKQKVIDAIDSGVFSKARICAKAGMDSQLFNATIVELKRAGVVFGDDGFYFLGEEMDKFEELLKKHIDELKGMMSAISAQVVRLEGSKNPEPAVVGDKLSTDELVSLGKAVGVKTKIALIVGHSNTAQGAVNYLGETEFSFNLRIAAMVEKMFSERESNVDLKLFFRPGGAAAPATAKVGKAVGEWGAKASLELHFNSFDQPAFGCEALVVLESGEILVEANFLKAMLNFFESEFKIKQRGIKVVKKGDSGFLNLKSCKENGVKMAFLFEPCFGNFKTKESQAVFENEKKYAQFLCDQIVKLSELV
jgi:N-acetylmuramoyl-L-alanine amidase